MIGKTFEDLSKFYKEEKQSLCIGLYTEIPTIEASHLLFWNNEADCLENCPG